MLPPRIERGKEERRGGEEEQRPAVEQYHLQHPYFKRRCFQSELGPADSSPGGLVRVNALSTAPDVRRQQAAACIDSASSAGLLAWTPTKIPQR